MKIAIIGVGNVGGAFSEALSKKGHTIYLGVRDAKNAKLKNLIKNNVFAMSVNEAAQQADVILIAVHPNSLQDVCNNVDKTNKIIVDITNSIAEKLEGFSSNSEAIASWLGSKNVVKAFNTIGANLIDNTKFGDVIAPTFMASDSQEAKKIVSDLAKDLGFREVIDCGSLASASLLEQLAGVWVGLAMRAGLGRNIAFDLLRK